jgi:cellulose synthase/poly-beta-1,6-N-acetylglucosamine synthase-like glycosyltransferase
VPALDEDTLADDMNIALQVRRRGHRCVVVEGARFSERRTDDARELVETKSRRAAGGIQELLRNRDLIASPRHGIFGLLIMPSALLYYVPVRVPALALLALAMLRRIGALPSALRALTIVTMLAAAAAVAVRARESVRMLFFNEWIFVQGWRRVLTRGMDVRWQQERSTRDRSPSDAHAETTR